MGDFMNGSDLLTIKSTELGLIRIPNSEFKIRDKIVKPTIDDKTVYTDPKKPGKPVMALDVQDVAEINITEPSENPKQIVDSFKDRKINSKPEQEIIAKLQAERDAKMKTVKNAKTFCQ